MKNLLKDKSGFTLVELMIATTILIIILASTTTLLVSSSQVSGRITSNSEAQLAAGNITERIRQLTVNSREVRLIDKSDTQWYDRVMDPTKGEFRLDANVPVVPGDFTDAPSGSRNFQKNYGYIVCGNPYDKTDGGITIYWPSGSGLDMTPLYDQGNTTGMKLYTRLYKSPGNLTIRIWGVDKRYNSWALFESPANSASGDEKNDIYFNTLRENSVFYQETTLKLLNDGKTSLRTDGNTNDLVLDGGKNGGRVLKFYIE